MTDMNTPPASPRQTDQWLEPGKTNVQIVYFLYIAGMFIPILPLVGLTHMVPDPVVTENLYTRIASTLVGALR